MHTLLISYMHMNLYKHLDIHIHTDTHIHTHTHKYVHTYIHTHMYIFKHTLTFRRDAAIVQILKTYHKRSQSASLKDALFGLAQKAFLEQLGLYSIGKLSFNFDHTKLDDEDVEDIKATERFTHGMQLLAIARSEGVVDVESQLDVFKAFHLNASDLRRAKAGSLLGALRRAGVRKVEDQVEVMKNADLDAADVAEINALMRRCH